MQNARQRIHCTIGEADGSSSALAAASSSALAAGYKSSSHFFAHLQRKRPPHSFLRRCTSACLSALDRKRPLTAAASGAAPSDTRVRSAGGRVLLESHLRWPDKWVEPAAPEYPCA